MDETLIGTVPTRPMTNQQRRAHRRLAHAEQTLIGYLVTYDVHPEDVTPEQIQRAEQHVARCTRAWKRACRRG